MKRISFLSDIQISMMTSLAMKFYAKNIPPSRRWRLFRQQRHFRTAKGFQSMIKMYNLWRKEQNFSHKFMNFKVFFVRILSVLFGAEIKLKSFLFQSELAVRNIKKWIPTKIQNWHSQRIPAYRPRFSRHSLQPEKQTNIRSSAIPHLREIARLQASTYGDLSNFSYFHRLWVHVWF